MNISSNIFKISYIWLIIKKKLQAPNMQINQNLIETS